MEYLGVETFEIVAFPKTQEKGRNNQKDDLAIYGVILHSLGSQISHLKLGNRGLPLGLASLFVALVPDNLLD